MAIKNDLKVFAQVGQKQAEEIIERVGKEVLEPGDEKALGSIGDTFKLYAKTHPQAKAQEFLGFYKDYVNVCAEGGKLPNDLRDNYKDWVRASRVPERYLRQVLDNGAAIKAYIRFGLDLEHQLDPDDALNRGLVDIARLEDRHALTACAAPEGFSAHKAFKVADAVLNCGIQGRSEVFVLFNEKGKLSQVVVRDFNGALHSSDTFDRPALERYQRAVGEKSAAITQVLTKGLDLENQLSPDDAVWETELVKLDDPSLLSEVSAPAGFTAHKTLKVADTALNSALRGRCEVFVLLDRDAKVSRVVVRDFNGKLVACDPIE